MLRGYGWHLYGDLVFYAAKLGDSAWFFFGGGLRFWDARYDPLTRYDRGHDEHFGVRIPLGLSFYTKHTPLEIFVQAGLWEDAWEALGLWADEQGAGQAPADPPARWIVPRRTAWPISSWS